ncbi:hypothetical protein SAMN05444336_109110 [Albimonas donghaensis]|uniref:DUF721 domain-containing protein n=1 Tax=Albimonas donghaensis TaxID=356660 RepID=A0A1H3EAH6_9RHOB|nr:DciA family protein [Albimonas donghaensis]SDX74924.1 hypothetical protein SAMN05444336_109110 [Albimonas donghaensis]
MGGTLGKDGGGRKGAAPRRPGRGPRAAMAGPAGGVSAPRKPAEPAAGPVAAPPAEKPAKRAPRKAAEPKRSARGFLQASALAEPSVREASSRRGFAEIRVLTDWPTIVGAQLSAACRPIRLTWAGAAYGATLIVEAEGARATEIEMQGPRIAERVNAHYGYRAVSRIKVVQGGRGTVARPGAVGVRGGAPGVRPGAAPGFAEPGPAPLRRDATPPPETEAEIDAVSDPGLRAALERLGASVANRKALGRR